MQTLRIGIQLPEVERVVRWPEYVAMARAAEEVGFDSLWLGDHLLYRGDGRPERGPWEAFTGLAALAAITERVVLGPLVACVAFHPPTLIAKMAASIDEISGGRFVLGLGAGWNRPEFDAFGLPFDHRVDRFADAYEIIRGLVSGERVTHDGAWWSADDAVLLPPAADGRAIPLMIGSNGPRMLRIALPSAAWWNTWFTDYGNRAEGFAALNRRITAAATAVGREPSSLGRSACVLVRAADGPEERPDPAAPAIAGSDDDIARELAAIIDAGADELIIVADPIDEQAIRRLGPIAAQVRVRGRA